MINFIQNKNKIIYTLKHRFAFEKCVEKYCDDKTKKELLQRAKFHDMDKVILSSLMYASLAAKIHRDFTKHHSVNNLKNLTRVDFLEMILDWECARYTKPDKPKNSFDTLYAFYPCLEKVIIPYLQELGLNKSNEGEFDSFIKKECDNYLVTDKMINDQIENYILEYNNSCDKYLVVERAIDVYNKMVVKKSKTKTL